MYHQFSRRANFPTRSRRVTVKVTSGHQCKGSEETGTTLMFGH